MLTLIRFCGVRADPRQIKTVDISQQEMMRQRFFTTKKFKACLKKTSGVRTDPAKPNKFFLTSVWGLMEINGD